MKGLTMLTVVINALVQQVELGGNGYCNHMFLLYVFEFMAEFPRSGMGTTQNSSTNQGPRVRTLIHIMHTGHTISSILITGRNEGFKVSLVCSQATHCPK